MTSVLYFLVVSLSLKFSLCSSVLLPSLVSLLDHSLGVETGRHHLHALCLLCSRASPGRELLHVWCPVCGCNLEDASRLPDSGDQGSLHSWYLRIIINNLCHPERSTSACLVPPFLWLLPGDTSMLLASGGQWSLSLWVPQDCNQQRKSA